MLDIATGARRGELLALQWPDIDFNTGIINITKSLEQTKEYGLRVKTTKSGKPRRFKVPDAALDALRSHRALQESDKDHSDLITRTINLYSVGLTVATTVLIGLAHAWWN